MGGEGYICSLHEHLPGPPSFFMGAQPHGGTQSFYLLRFTVLPSLEMVMLGFLLKRRLAFDRFLKLNKFSLI